MTSNYTLDITFNDNPDGIFYPGQTVKGEKALAYAVDLFR